MFSSEIREITKNTFFTEHLWTTASALCHEMSDRKYDCEPFNTDFVIHDFFNTIIRTRSRHLLAQSY